MSSADALNILGLDSDASASEIKGAYKDLVKVWHPDRFGSDLPLKLKAEERLKQINLAYQTLQGYFPKAGPVPPGAQRRETQPRSAPPSDQPYGEAPADTAEAQSDNYRSPTAANIPNVGEGNGFSPWALGLFAVVITAFLGYLGSTYIDHDARLRNAQSRPVSTTIPKQNAPRTLAEAFQGAEQQPGTAPKDFSYINALPTFEQRTTAIADRLASIKANPRYQALPEERKVRVLTDLYQKYVLPAYANFHRPVPDAKSWVEANR